MQIEFTNMESFLSEVAKEAKKAFRPEVMDAVTQEIITIIRERTRVEKVDINGAPFKPYSTKPCYFSTSSKYNTERLAPAGGRLTKSGKSMYFASGYSEYKDNISGSAPNLTNLGTTLNSMTFKTGSSNSRIIYFSEAGSRGKASNNVIATANNDGTNKIPKREFFGINRDSEQEKLKTLWEKLSNAVNTQ